VKDYNHRIEAINYTLAHDDGVTHRGWRKPTSSWSACRAAARPPPASTWRCSSGSRPPTIRSSGRPRGAPHPLLAPAPEAQGLGTLDRAGAPHADPRRTPAGLEVRLPGELPLRGDRSREAHAAGRNSVPSTRPPNRSREIATPHAARGAPGEAGPTRHLVRR
jgi:hypothetical protein